MFMRVCSFALLAVATCTMSGCLIVPYKAKPITMTSAGSINRDVLLPGLPRKFVSGMLGDSLVAVGPHLAWARVQYSNSGTFGALAVGDPGGVFFFTSANRNWKAQNLMIEFDEQDRIRQYHIVSDSKLLPEVDKLLKDGSLEEPNFTTPVTLILDIEAFYGSSTRPTGRLTLSEGGISWLVDKQLNVKVVTLTNVRHRKICPHPHASEPELMNENLCASFDLQTSGMPVHVTVRVSARDFFVLVAYARKFQYASTSGG